MDNKKIIIITGLSGSGKTTALNALEDWGYYTIDNLPCELGTEILNMRYSNIAIGMDIRSFYQSHEFIDFVNKLIHKNVDLTVVFLTARKEVLINRYNLTRRRHPLPTTSVEESVQKEIKVMDRIKEISTIVINTSDSTPKAFTTKLENILGINNYNKKINIHIKSYGFKYGIPIDLDLAFDVRFLPNPYYIPDLKEKTGLDTHVAQYVKSFDITHKFYNKLIDMIKFLIPLYIEEGKKHLTIGIGCSGGKHRSVVIAEWLYNDLSENIGYGVQISHREKERNKWH